MYTASSLFDLHKKTSSIYYPKNKIKSSSSANMGVLYGDPFYYLSQQLLVLIISFLPFKEAARTAILSKRWRRTWLRLGLENMNFDEKLFLDETDQGTDEITKEKKRRDFLDYLRRCLELLYDDNDNQISDNDDYKFRLAFSRPENHHAELQQFIDIGLSTKIPKCVDLDFSDPSWNEDTDEEYQTFLSLPNYNGNEMLESLKLYSCNVPRITEFRRFLALKDLSLGWIQLSPNFINNLLSKCPNLETLSLKKCWNVGKCQIRGGNLRRLVLDKCFPDRPELFMVGARKLKSFVYNGMITEFQFDNFECLEEAILDIRVERVYDEYICCEKLGYMLGHVTPVRTLTVCSYMLQAIYLGQVEPHLGHVRHLILKTAAHLDEFYGITLFLKICPVLEVLTFDLGPLKLIPNHEHLYLLNRHDFIHYDPQVQPYRCVRKTLKSIEMKGFKGDPNELLILKYFLKYGDVLETVSIVLSNETGANGESMKEIYEENARTVFDYEKASQNVKVLISSLP